MLQGVPQGSWKYFTVIRLAEWDLLVPRLHFARVKQHKNTSMPGHTCVFSLAGVDVLQGQNCKRAKCLPDTGVTGLKSGSLK